MQRRTRLTWLCVLLAAGACASGESGTTTRPEPEAPDAVGRLIEEGDIVRLDEAAARLFLLGQRRGFMVVDLADKANPRLGAAVGLTLPPLELYVKDGWVIVLTADDAESEVVFIDVRDPAQPKLGMRLPITRQIGDSRMVGDVLYVVSERGVVVQSIDVKDPAAPRLGERVRFPASAHGNHVLTTDRIFYIASTPERPLGECDPTRYRGEGCTLITAVDVSDPAGAIRIGASYFMKGTLLDRWSLDHHEGALRVVVAPERWSSSRFPGRVRTFRAADAYELEPLGSVPLVPGRPESLTSVRFDGVRGFAVTFERTDPLFTIDLTDPARPRVLAKLETPGWVDFMVPRGDRLIGIGHDQVASGDPWELHASIYDVSDLSRPKLLDRKIFGEGSGNHQIADVRDNYAKVIRVVDQLGLLLVPFNLSEWTRTGQVTEGRLQLFRFTRDQLTRGGLLDHPGVIRRALPFGPSHVVAISDRALEVVDIADIGQPRVIGRLGREIFQYFSATLTEEETDVAR